MLLRTSRSGAAAKGVVSMGARLLSTPDLKIAPPKQAQNIKYFKIYRWDPEQKQKPYVSTYPVNLSEVIRRTSIHITHHTH